MTAILPNHIGWQLWQASRKWTETFVSRLQVSGYPEITFALANVLGNLDRRAGVRQTLIAERCGLTKQAVGQFLANLENAELVERISDPEDGRAQLVRYTTRGEKFLEIADRIKKEIESEYAEVIGQRNMTLLKQMTAQLAARG